MIGFVNTVVLPGSFQPSWFSSCKLWLRADLGITIVTGVSQWNDQTSNGSNVTQTTGANQPGHSLTGAPNNLPTLTFNGSQWLTKASALLSASPWTIITIQKMASTAAQIASVYIGNGSAGDGFGFVPLSVRDVLYSGVANLTGGAATTAWEGWTSTNNGSTTTLRVNGSAVSLTNSTLQPIAPSALTDIGAVRNQASDPWNGSIAEVMLFNVVLSAAQITEIENYLSARYGIA